MDDCTLSADDSVDVCSENRGNPRNELPVLAARFQSEWGGRGLSVVNNIAAACLKVNESTTGALSSAAWQLLSVDEFAGFSREEQRELSAYLYDFAQSIGRKPPESFQDFAERVWQYTSSDITPPHRCLNAAIWHARDWIQGRDVPPELRCIARALGIDDDRRFLMLCIMWSLQQRNGDGWFIAPKSLGDSVRVHGIDVDLPGRTVRHFMDKCRKEGIIERTTDAVFAKKCGLHRFRAVAVPDTIPDLSLTSALRFTQPSPVLAPYYQAGLTFFPPASLSSLRESQAAGNSPSPYRDNNIVANGSLAQNIVAMGSGRYENADKDAVKRAAYGRWVEIFEDIANVDFERGRGRGVWCTCPSCGAKKKFTLWENGGGYCLKCGVLGLDGFALLQTLLDISFHESVVLVAEYLDVPGRVVIQDKRDNVHHGKATIDTIRQQVADLKNIPEAALDHYGAYAVERDHQHKNVTLWNAVMRVPMRRAEDLKESAYLDLGVDCAMLQKGCCEAGCGDRITAYLPDDWRHDDGKPVVLCQGPKDTMAAWAAAGPDSGIHFIGLQITRNVPADLLAALASRDVTITHDCDPSGRSDAQRCLRAVRTVDTARVEVVDLAPDRNGKEGIRELLKTVDGQEAFHSMVDRIRQRNGDVPPLVPQGAGSSEYYDLGF